MGFVLELLTLPVLGAPRMLHWLAQTVAGEAQREFLDEGRIRAALLELQERFSAGDLEEREYQQQEEVLLERLAAIRELKARHSEGQ